MLHQQVVKAETQVQEMDAELGRMSGDYTKQVELRLKSVAMDEMVSTVHDMLTTSPYPEVQQALDKTLAKEFAMRFSGIIGCAILLSVGLVDQATTLQRVTAVVAVEVICPGADVKTRMNASG